MVGLLLLCIAAYGVQNVFKKQFSIGDGLGNVFFSAVMALFSTSYFAVLGFIQGFDFSIEVLPYSLLFALCAGVTMVSSVAAMHLGSFALTNMIISYSLVIPTLYGPIFLNDKISVFAYVGIAVLLISLYLVRAPKDSAERPTLKWLIVVIVAFVSNGMCSVIQKMQQSAQEEKYKCELMIIAMGALTVVLFVLSAFKDRGAWRAIFRQKRAIIWPLSCGVANGTSNHLVMVLTGMMSTAVFFPIISASALIIAFAFSVFVYKEKFLPRQLVAVLMSVVAIVLLNI